MTEGKYEVAKGEPTYAQRFTRMVVREFGAQVGTMALTPYQQKLAQHMFIAIDNQLKTLEAKRKDQNKPAIVWSNINMEKLAIDAVHRVELGLDALIPNHLHPIPYLNGKTGKYDLDMRIGYAGKDCYRRKMALDPPVEIVYELVYSSDEFTPIKKSLDSKVESYHFKVTNAFDRGEVVGGFGYIVYENPHRNKLVLVSKKDFNRSKAQAKSKDFWDNHPERMQYKTLVHRTTEVLAIDPEKVNQSFLQVEMDDAINGAQMEIDEKANREFIDVDASGAYTRRDGITGETVHTGGPLAKSGVEDTETTPPPDQSIVDAEFEESGSPDSLDGKPDDVDPETGIEYPDTIEPAF